MLPQEPLFVTLVKLVVGRIRLKIGGNRVGSLTPRHYVVLPNNTSIT